MGDFVVVQRVGARPSVVASKDYVDEDELQQLLVEAPALLSIVSAEPVEFLLVKREMGVPIEAGGLDQFSLDHLFLDDQGIPTLVEVKRSANREIRRMIVGQMLDYAANGVRYWPMERLRQSFDETCAAAGIDPTNRMNEFAGRTDPDEYWKAVGDNLARGRLRLLFVSDRIPLELQRIIEFLNEQLREADVLGVEISRYQHEGEQIYVPRVVGATAQAQAVKASAAQTTFVEMLEAAAPVVQQAAELLDRFFKIHAIASRDSPQSRLWVPPHGARARLWLDQDALSLELSALPVDPSELQGNIERVIGRKTGSKRPQIPCTVLVERWEEVEATVLAPFLAIAPESVPRDRNETDGGDNHPVTE